MAEKELPRLNHHLQEREQFGKFMDIMSLYRQAVNNPDSNISLIFGLENHVRDFCEKYNLDFIKIRESIMKDMPLDYTKYIENWTIKDNK